MIYYYHYYDKIIRSSLPLRTLQPLSICESGISDSSIIDLDIMTESDCISRSSTAEITENGDAFRLSICGDPIYCIYKTGNRIQVLSHDISYVEDSIINLPATVLSLIYGRILMHCSSMIVNDSAYIFMGEKGIGKTTFSLIMSEKYPLLGDDTLMLCNAANGNYIEVIPSRTLFKLTEQTMINFNDQILERSDFALHSEKYLCRVRNVAPGDIRYRLKGIIALKRTSCIGGETKPIASQFAKKLMLIKNIVGSQFLSHQYINTLINTDLFQKICAYPMYSWEIPEGIHCAKRNINEYVNVIDKMEMTL